MLGPCLAPVYNIQVAGGERGGGSEHLTFLQKRGALGEIQQFLKNGFLKIH